MTICGKCGRAVFPRRVLCPKCGAGSWKQGLAERGVVEEVTESAGTRIAAVRTDLGPVVVSRVRGQVAAGDAVRLESDGGVPVVDLDQLEGVG